jgi:hypothetical protein
MLLLIRPKSGAGGDPPAGNSAIVQTVTGIEQGMILRFRVDIWNEVNTRARAGVVWLDADGGVVQDGVGGQSVLQAAWDVTSTWHSREGYFKAPPGASKAQVQLYSNESTPTSEVRFDNVSLCIWSWPTTLMAGPLLNKRQRRQAGTLRTTEVQAVGWGWFLDHREVQSFTGTTVKLINEWGGPIEGFPNNDRDGYIREYSTTADTLTRQSLRSCIEALNDPGDVGWKEPFQYYVDNERQFHHWDQSSLPSQYDYYVYGGIARSIGDQGDFVPEYLSWDESAEGHLHYLYPLYDDAAILHPWRGTWGFGDAVSLQQPWVAGETFASLATVYDPAGTNYAPLLTLLQVDDYLNNFAGLQKVISFTTTEYGGWQPHQQITINDTALTDGAEEVAYIENVSGTIDHRNIIEWTVEIGNPRRSLVHTVAST